MWTSGGEDWRFSRPLGNRERALGIAATERGIELLGNIALQLTVMRSNQPELSTQAISDFHFPVPFVDVLATATIIIDWIDRVGRMGTATQEIEDRDRIVADALLQDQAEASRLLAPFVNPASVQKVVKIWGMGRGK